MAAGGVAAAFAAAAATEAGRAFGRAFFSAGSAGGAAAASAASAAARLTEAGRGFDFDGGVPSNRVKPSAVSVPSRLGVACAAAGAPGTAG
ncbi:hypothetical protein ACTTAL_14600 [Rhodobacter capsulatus]